jgi:hypothetical protein
MSLNFEEQFLLMVTPYDRTFNGYYGSYKVDKSGKLIIDPSGNYVDQDPKLVGKLIPVEPIENATVWEKAVREDIKKISQTKVGSLLLHSIKHHGQIVNIRPKRSNDCNAGVKEGEEIHNKDKLKIGTAAIIEFSPEIYEHGGLCETNNLESGGFRHESHETLLHELVHAFRQVSGKMNLYPPKIGKGLSFYGNHEEFNAVLVQGIYASERRTPIRASHSGYSEIDKKLNGSLKFFQASSEAFQYVEKFCLENPDFTRGFININAPFNPINAYYQDREIARQFSKSATARGRDKVMPILKVIKNFIRDNPQKVP